MVSILGHPHHSDDSRVSERRCSHSRFLLLWVHQLLLICPWKCRPGLRGPPLCYHYFFPVQFRCSDSPEIGVDRYTKILIDMRQFNFGAISLLKFLSFYIISF